MHLLGKNKFLVKNNRKFVEVVTAVLGIHFIYSYLFSALFHRYLEKKAVDIGMTHILIEACQIQGKKYVNMVSVF